jgi:hypothetical protein
VRKGSTTRVRRLCRIDLGVDGYQNLQGRVC